MSDVRISPEALDSLMEARDKSGALQARVDEVEHGLVILKEMVKKASNDKEAMMNLLEYLKG